MALNTASVPASGFIRVGAIMNLPAVLRELGHAPGPILQQVGLTLQAIENPDLVIPFTTMGRLLKHCVQISGCHHFGLLVGQRVSASSLGITGFVLQHARDVGAALADLRLYSNLHDQGAAITLVNDAGSSMLAYSIYEDGVEATDQIYDGAIAVAFNILRSLCGPKWKPEQVVLAHSRPEQTAPFETFFQAPVRFETEQSALVFSNHWLTVVPTRSDPLLYRHMKRQADQLQVSQPADVTGKLRLLLRVLLLGQQCSLAEASSQLGIHSRTLNRRLQAEGTTFRDEVDAARFAMARQLLADSTLGIGSIAVMLGYADASAFDHAFKRWSGVTPGQWRLN